MAAIVLRPLNLIPSQLKDFMRKSSLFTRLTWCLSCCALLVCLLSPAPAVSQTTPAQQQQARQELAGRNIDQMELRRRLLERGIDIDNASPDELLRVQPQVEAVIAQMEAEARRDNQSTGETTADQVERAVEEGASIQEAVSETVNEAVRPILPPSEIYGHNVFRNKSIKVYRRTENATPPDSYPLRAGDQIAISIFGTSQADLLLEIGQDGFIRPPRMPRIYLQNIPLGQARELLRSRFRQYYVFENGQFSVTMDLARTISVNIFGEVESNGTFTLSSINTAFNALVAAGGPTERGTVRNIKLTSGGRATTIDVYKFLQDPGEDTELFLANNDIIYVPLATTVVTLEGGVARPMKYELKEGETLSDLLAFAGGTTTRAATGNITVTRYEDGRLEVIDVDLTQQTNFVLQDADVVSVPEINNPIQNYVSIQGEVLLPGRFSFTPGITLADLVRQGRLRPDARRDVAFLFRSNDDGTKRLIRVNLGEDAGAVQELALRRGDRLQVLAQSRFIDDANFTVRGAVRDTVVTLPFPQDGNLTLEEAILLAGGTRPDAAPEVMLLRTPVDNPEERVYERVNLANAGTVELRPRDEVVVYQRGRFNDQLRVSVSGLVRSPGSFIYGPTLELRDLLYLAGGVRLGADRTRVDVFRLSIDEDGRETRTLVETIAIDADLNAVNSTYVLQPFDQVVVRRGAGFEAIENVVLVGEVEYPGPYALLNDNERLSDVIRRAGGLTPEAFPAGATLYRDVENIGYVVLDLDRVMVNPADPANIILRSDDTLYIPKRQELVTIYTSNTLADRFGRDSTTQDGSIQVAYQGPRSANWYIKNYAGGFNDDNARKRWTTVEYANGQVAETSNFLGIKNYPELRPGAEIRVPAAPPKQRRERREERFDWLGWTRVVLTTATTITTFILLNNR